MYSHEAHVTPDSDYYVYTPSSLARRLFFYPVCTGHFTYEPGYSLERNHYDSFLVMFLLTGSCSVTQHGRTAAARAGQAVLLDCYAPHAYSSEPGCESLWIHFDGPLSRQYYEQIQSSSGAILSPADPDALRNSLSAICRIFKEGRSIDEARISLEITKILTGLLAGSAEKETASVQKPSLSTTISYINEHFSEDISLEKLAETASLSPFYFTRLFARETGMTPHRYLIETRLTAARFLLKTTDLPVKEIGFSCGFSTESSFCATFRKRELMTPTEYRRST